jgi:mRNA interferase MazF
MSWVIDPAMARGYTPERNHIVWLDFEPTKGREIGKYRPALVLSSREYNRKTGLVICCPISTSIRGGITEVPVANLEQPSVVAASLIQTFSWTKRKIKFITEAEPGVMDEVLYRIIPLIGADQLVEKLLNEK